MMIKNVEIKATFNKVISSLKTLKEGGWDEMFEMPVTKVLFEDLPRAIKTLEDEPEAKSEDVLDKMSKTNDILETTIMKSDNIATLRNFAMTLKKENDELKKNKEVETLFDMYKISYDPSNYSRVREICKIQHETKRISPENLEWLIKNKSGNTELRIAQIADETQRLINLGGIKAKIDR